jgi:hydrogenase maturation factor HypF (carbamoyltransferase family)
MPSNKQNILMESTLFLTEDILNEGVFSKVKSQIVSKMEKNKARKELIKELKSNCKEEGKKFDILLINNESVDEFINALIVAIPNYNLKTLRAEIGYNKQNIQSYAGAIKEGKFSSKQKPLAVRMVNGFKKYGTELAKAEKKKAREE